MQFNEIKSKTNWNDRKWTSVVSVVFVNYVGVFVTWWWAINWWRSWDSSTSWKPGWEPAPLEEDSHRHNTQLEEHRTFLSHDVSEALGRGKTEEEVEGDRELNTAILVGIVMIHVFSRSKSMPSERPRWFSGASSSPPSIHTQAGDCLHTEATTHTHKITGTAASITGSSRYFDVNCTQKACSSARRMFDSQDVHREQQMTGITHV